MGVFLKKQEFSRMSKYHNKSHKLRNLFIIIVVCGSLITILFGISSLSNNHSNKTPTTNLNNSSNNPQSSLASSSVSLPSSQISSIVNSTLNTEEDTPSSNSTNSPTNTSNNTFDDLQTAIAYGRQCVNNHTCNNFKVVNNDGKYVVELY